MDAFLSMFAFVLGGWLLCERFAQHECQAVHPIYHFLFFAGRLHHGSRAERPTWEHRATNVKFSERREKAVGGCVGAFFVGGILLFRGGFLPKNRKEAHSLGPTKTHPHVHAVGTLAVFGHGRGSQSGRGLRLSRWLRGTESGRFREPLTEDAVRGLDFRQVQAETNHPSLMRYGPRNAVPLQGRQVDEGQGMIPLQQRWRTPTTNG